MPARTVDAVRIVPQRRVRAPGRRGAPLLATAWMSLILRVGPLALLSRGVPAQVDPGGQARLSRGDRSGEPTPADNRRRKRRYRGINRMH